MRAGMTESEGGALFAVASRAAHVRPWFSGGARSPSMRPSHPL